MNNAPNIQINTPYIAVDGGGTRCRLAHSSKGQVTTVEVGSANISTNFQATSQEILKGLRLLALKTGQEVGAFAKMPAYLGLAGMTGPNIANQLADALPFKQVRIEDDRPSALRGALGERDGIVAHCGTGSFIAAQTDTKMRFAGGWGPVLGDQASAQWVGRRALAHTLGVVDRLRAPSNLATELLGRFDGPAGIVAFAGIASPAEFGQIARDVTRHADEGDSLARGLMQDATNELVTVIRKLGWTQSSVICLTGGIAPHYAPYLPPDMRASLTPPAGPPLDGALALAQVYCQEIITGDHL